MMPFFVFFCFFFHSSVCIQSEHICVSFWFTSSPSCATSFMQCRRTASSYCSVKWSCNQKIYFNPSVAASQDKWTSFIADGSGEEWGRVGKPEICSSAYCSLAITQIIYTISNLSNFADYWDCME